MSLSASQMVSKDRAARLRSKAFSFAKAVSMGLRSGEYGGSGNSPAPRWRTSSAARSLLWITERGYPVAEVAKRLGVSQHSLYAWKRKFSKPSGSTGGDQAADIRRLRTGLLLLQHTDDLLFREP